MDPKKDKEFTYFQYYKDFKLPLFIKLVLTEFDTALVNFLNENCFTQLSQSEYKKAEEEIKDKSKIRILCLREATPAIAQNISFFYEGDVYGQESITLKQNYKLYRYKGVAVGIFSSGAKEWELGCFHDFGTGENKLAYSVVINRFLSWAMTGLGIVGFWGVPVDEGVVVMNQTESKGEAVFFDIYKNVVYSLDGIKKIGPGFVIMRLDRTLKGRNIKMTSSELSSFLAVNTCYFDLSGLSIPVRQMIRNISLNINGLLHPKESFKPRTDLSL